MKLFFSILLLCFSHQSAISQLKITEKTEEEIKSNIVEELFNTRVKKEFTLATQAAKKIGLSDQVILEATFLYHIDKMEYPAIIKLTEKFSQMAEQFDPNESKIFSTKEDWLSVIEYGLALKALDQKNIPLFKSHILEAFWLSPDKASAFAPHINHLHTKAAMEKIQLKMGQQIFQVNDDKAITLEKMLENKEALLLRFWSPWSQDAQISFPVTQHLAKQCAQHKISFASMLINQDPQGIKDNLEIIAENGNKLPTYWLADEDNSALTKLLRVTDLPTFVLVSREGKILYNGSISDKNLWVALTKVAPNFQPRD